jgi:DNA repair protein RadC
MFRDLSNKLRNLGEEGLSDTELLAIALGNETAAQALFEKFGSLRQIYQAGPKGLRPIQGIGERKICQWQAFQGIERRIMREQLSRGRKFQNSRDVAESLRGFVIHETRELFLTLPLDAQNRLIRPPLLISIGSLICTVVHPREVFFPLIQEKAVAAILIHNHPSSHDPHPSEEDLALSQRLKATGEIVGIKLLDHIILGGSDYFSFTDEGLW